MGMICDVFALNVSLECFVIPKNFMVLIIVTMHRM